jgi:four helix bundle protein
MKENIVREKSFRFALRIVKTYRQLTEDRREFVLSKQLLRSGTSVGANIEEAIGGLSEKDFVCKLTIAYKEARETIYWLRLLEGGDYLSQSDAKELIQDCVELCRIIGSIQITIKNKSSNIRNS